MKLEITKQVSVKDADLPFAQKEELKSNIRDYRGVPTATGVLMYFCACGQEGDEVTSYSFTLTIETFNTLLDSKGFVKTLGSLDDLTDNITATTMRISE